MIKPELLVPAGNQEKLEVAAAYGADAVYFGGRDFSLRARAGNFSLAELPAAIAFCREKGIKAYLAVNLLAGNADFPPLAEFLAELRPQPPDALIVADPGVLTLCRELLPAIPLHLSTQANSLNYRTAAFWRRQGVSRINLARELSLAEIAEIIRRVPDLECEVFVHGAMCMAYSGRCLLSAALSGRSANRGDCAQPCRWSYALVEETRPGEYLTLEEDQRGSYIFNSRDLCLLARLPELVAAGISSCKIEGRMKSAYYVAVVTRVYRRALDRLAAAGGFSAAELAAWKKELTRVSHRRYTEAFIDGGRPQAKDPVQYPADSAYLRNSQFVALVSRVLAYDPVTDCSEVELQVKARLAAGAEIEVITPEMDDFTTTIVELKRIQGEKTALAHPGTVARARCRGRLKALQILRRPLAGRESGD
jgi:putative protease